MLKCLLKKKLENVINNSGCDLIHFEYNRRIFGNMIVIIRKNNELYEFVSDRGEIRNNKGFWIDNSYIRAESKNTFNKLLEVLSEELPKL